jgi:hypothetical protein
MSGKPMPTRESRRAEWLTKATAIAAPLLPHVTEGDVYEGLAAAVPHWTTSKRDASAAAAPFWLAPEVAAERVLLAVAQGTVRAAQPLPVVTDLRSWSLRRGAPTPPAGAVRVDRGTPYGNPFVIGRDGTREEVIAKCRKWIDAEEQKQLRARARVELVGRHVLCWCAPDACHGDIWIEVANAPEAAAA